MPGLRTLKEIIEAGGDNIPALKKLLDSQNAKLSDVYELDKPFYHGTGSDFDKYNADQYFSSSPEISSGYSTDPWEIYDLDRLDVANKHGFQPNVRKVYLAKDGKYGSYYGKDDLSQLAKEKGGEIDEDLPWLDIDNRSGDGWLNKSLDRRHTGVEFDWDAEYSVDGSLINPKSTERMVFDPESDVVDAGSLQKILNDPEGAKLRSLIGGSAIGALSALAPSEAEAHGTIEAPRYPILADIADMIKKVERANKGSPAEFIIPTGVAPWLREIAYNRKPSMEQRANAVLDFL